MPPLLSIQKLKVDLQDPDRLEVGSILRDVNFNIAEGETLALVGESGCGKSMTALSILRLLPDPPIRMVSGKILFKGRDLNEMSPVEWGKIRGGEISIVFQDPQTSLNPVMKIGEQVAEALRIYSEDHPRQTRGRIQALLMDVGLSDVERIYDQYPHQLSGGMCQRVMLAMAIACGPALLIADEPTTALDVTVQAQILELLFGMKEKHSLSVLFITHDLRLVRGHADRVAVLYAGQVVEEGKPEDLFEAPQHPYTEGLIASLPGSSHRGSPLFNIQGSVPTPFDRFQGCAFADRCGRVQPNCRTEAPDLTEKSKGHWSRCFYPSIK